MEPEGEIFEANTWFGEFHFPGKYSDRFVGELSCSPSGGIILKISTISVLPTAEENCVYGILSNGQKCTLWKGFDPRNISFCQSGSDFIFQGYASFSYLALGAWIGPTEKTKEFYFSFEGSQAFFKDDFNGRNSDFSLDPLIRVQLDFGVLRLLDLPSFNVITNPKGVFHSFNSEALEELLAKFEEIHEKDAAVIHLKDSNFVCFSLSFNDEVDFFQAYLKISKIARLMTVLLCDLSPELAPLVR